MSTASLASLARSIVSGVDRASTLLAWAVMASLAAMMLFTTANVFLRYLFRRSIMGATELVGHYFMVAVVFLPLAYAMTKRGGHIKVDLVVSHLPFRVRSILNVIGLALSLGIYSLISYYGAVGAFHSWQSGETMVNVSLPLWPGRALVVIGGGLLCVQIVLAIYRNLAELVTNSG